jgi:hypothetical protein
MRSAHVLVLFVTGVFALSCGKSTDSIELLVKAVGPEQLRRDAAVLYKQAFSAHTTSFVVIQKSAWPASFRRFDPIRVGAYLDGFSLTLESTPLSESGVYVVPLDIDRIPAQAAGTHFERIADGIFRYSFRN